MERLSHLLKGRESIVIHTLLGQGRVFSKDRLQVPPDNYVAFDGLVYVWVKPICSYQSC
jgi:hypothetical protein